MPRHQPIAVRMAQKIRVSETGCHEWRGAMTFTGYGIAYFECRYQQAHRVAWIVANGPIPDGMIVMHKCDNPPCVNPEHLMLGTYADNSRDMVVKGRSVKGRSRVTLINDPRRVVAREYTRKRYNSDPEYRARNRAYHKAWRHEQAVKERAAREQTPEWQAKQAARAQEDAYAQERERMRATGYSMREIAQLIGVQPSTVMRWLDSGKLSYDAEAAKYGLHIVSPDMLFPFLSTWRRRQSQHKIVRSA